MNLCIIPARGGSKRIPRKNIKPFCGQPMIAYSIQAALQSACFDAVIVSTDDADIADIAQTYGAEAPFIRPTQIADDHATTAAVIRHAIETLMLDDIQPEYVCCVYATAPFVQAGDIQRGLALLQNSGADYAFSVTTFPFPIQRALRCSAEGVLSMFQPENFARRSQDLEEAWHDAGQFYWGSTAAWRVEKPIFNARARAVSLPRYRVQDIDTEEDWQRAELMYQALQKHGEQA